jgi:hypothetical protein
MENNPPSCKRLIKYWLKYVGLKIDKEKMLFSSDIHGSIIFLDKDTYSTEYGYRSISKNLKDWTGYYNNEF